MPPSDTQPISIRDARQMAEAAANLAGVALKLAIEGQPDRAARLADELDATAKAVAAHNPHQAALFRSVSAALRADIG